MFTDLGYPEMLLFGIIALLLFGSKLPDVARNFGRGYREIRKKMDDLQREYRDWDKIDSSAPTKPQQFTVQDDEPSKSQPTAPKFVPPADDD